MTRRVVVLAGPSDVARGVAGAVQAELAAAHVPVSLVRARRPEADGSAAPRHGRDAPALVRDAVRALQTYAEGPVDVVLCCPADLAADCVRRLEGTGARVVVATADPAADETLVGESAHPHLDHLDRLDVVVHEDAAPAAVARAVLGSLGVSELPDHPGWLTGS